MSISVLDFNQKSIISASHTRWAAELEWNMKYESDPYRILMQIKIYYLKQDFKCTYIYLMYFLIR